MTTKELISLLEKVSPETEIVLIPSLRSDETVNMEFFYDVDFSLQAGKVIFWVGDLHD